MSKTLFEKIIAREIPATIVYEDDLVLAIRDINPAGAEACLDFPEKADSAHGRGQGRKTSNCSAICCSKPPKWPANWV